MLDDSEASALHRLLVANGTHGVMLSMIEWMNEGRRDDGSPQMTREQAVTYFSGLARECVPAAMMDESRANRLALLRKQRSILQQMKQSLNDESAKRAQGERVVKSK